MARKTLPLSDSEIKNSKPKEKEYNLADGEGLYLRIKPTGSKAWIFNYIRPISEKRSNLSLGNYPAMSLALAREKKNEYRKLLAQNIDPQLHLEELERSAKYAFANTFQAVSVLWLETKKGEVTDDYITKITNSFENHLFKFIGSQAVTTLTAPQVIALLKPLAAKGSLETVSRLCYRINEVMDYAVNTGIAQSNPLANIKAAFQAPKSKNMATLNPSELPELMQTLSRASIKLTTRCLIEWQLHTMVRPNEAAGARWDEIDLANRLWTIPASRMKKKRPHSVPLTDQTLQLLEVMRPISSRRAYVFPADRNFTQPTNEQTANMALKRMGFKNRLVAHGLRALASTTLNEQGFDADVIESALAHKDKDEVRAAYNRATYLERRRVIMQWWSEHIEQAASGNLSLGAGKKNLSLVG
jgi:integrase